MVQIALNWKDYELLDFEDGEKLERFGNFILRRPDQNAVSVEGSMPVKTAWQNIDMSFKRVSKDTGVWKIRNLDLPSEWLVHYKALTFVIKPTKYKHVGLFPEQSTNWDWIEKTIQKALKIDPKKNIRVLNLFAYTGGATLAACSAGASEVVHIDSSKGANSLAKENQNLSGLESKSIRVITEDVKKFVARELKRGNKYDAIIMDPPLYGRGPKGELWKIDKDLMPLLGDCIELLSENPLFFIVNLYAGNALKDQVFQYLAKEIRVQLGGTIESFTLGLRAKTIGKLLNCGDVVRWAR